MKFLKVSILGLVVTQNTFDEVTMTIFLVIDRFFWPTALGLLGQSY